jgi:hypothetical protein
MSWLAVIIAPLLLQLVLLFALSGVVNGVAYARLGKTFYLLLMWPGVVVHELSHLVGCVVTGTPVRKVRLFAPRDEGQGRLVLGFVEHDRPRNPLVRSVIGGAPFFGGAAALWALTAFVLPAVGSAHSFAPIVARAPSAGAVIEAMVAAARQYAAFAASVAGGLDWRSWQTYLFLYLALSIAAHVAPSRTDLRNASFGIVAGALFLVLASLAGRAWAPAFTVTATLWLAKAVGAVTVLLSFGLVTLMVAAALFFLLDVAFAASSRR